MGCRCVIPGILFLFSATQAITKDNPTQQPATTATQVNQMESQSQERAIFNLQTDMDEAYLAKYIGEAMHEAISAGDIPGGVVLILLNDVVFHQAYGNRAIIPKVELATLDTIYDLASLTKSVATATSILMLIEQGKIRLNDTIDKFIPEWKNTEDEKTDARLLERLQKAIDNGKIKMSVGRWDAADNETAGLLTNALTTFSDLEASSQIKESFELLPRDRESITIRHLLTHTSGLPSFLRFYEKFPEGNAHKKIVTDIARLKLRGPVGGQFIYSDLGFIVLGDIVERVTGQPLDQFSEENIFKPLGMNDTMFNPPGELKARIAPTEWRVKQDIQNNETSRTLIRGEVHDGNAWVQNGVSGHAGLFSRAEDLGVFCKMLLNAGVGNGHRILSPITIQALFRDNANLPGGEPQRGLGWDLTSSFASQKGDLFENGFGHTGFTGTSLWIVPEENLAIIILTNRVHPEGKGNTTPLRAKIANIVAASITRSYKEQTPER